MPVAGVGNNAVASPERYRLHPGFLDGRLPVFLCILSGAGCAGCCRPLALGCSVDLPSSSLDSSSIAISSKRLMLDWSITPSKTSWLPAEESALWYSKGQSYLVSSSTDSIWMEHSVLSASEISIVSNIAGLRPHTFAREAIPIALDNGILSSLGGP